MQLEELFLHTDQTPQAVCFVGKKEHVLEILRKRNQEYTLHEYSRLLLDDAKHIRKLLRQQSRQIQITIIATETIGIEAQNALLKIIEEPAPGNAIVFCLPTLEGILDTVLSRLQIVRGQATQSEHNPLAAWLLLSIPKRLDQADTWIQKAKKSGDQAELRGQLLAHITDLEQYLYAVEPKKRNYSTLRILQTLQGYLQSQGSSPKYILEYLALSLPTA